MKQPFSTALFLAGLAIVGWIGVGYVGTHALGVVVTLVIGACYVAGAVELQRYRQATASLARALDDTAPAGNSLQAWLAPLHPSLRQAVRLRVEGERVALPAPSLTPYLVGLLVLLGMLGTLLGMMVTLRGTGLALEGATDIDAIRGSLAAPVKGLGFAFGTSIAGVAASAILGLLSALSRRERVLVAQRLDDAIATSLHVHSQSFQREQSFRLLQQQAALMPELVERLQAMVAGIERQTTDAAAQQAVRQESFHARTEAAQAELASTLVATMQAGVDSSAHAVGAALQPVVEATLAGVAREAGALQQTVGNAVQQQLEALTAGFGTATTAAAAAWQAALARQQDAHDALVARLEDHAQRQATQFDQRSQAWLDAAAGQLEHTATTLAEGWSQALSQQASTADGIATRHADALSAVGADFRTQATALVEAVDASHASLQRTLAEQDDARLAAWAEQLATMSATLRGDWERTAAEAARLQQDICDALARSANDITAQAQAHAQQTIAEISQLVQVASEAPRAAADVVAELRQKLSDSMVRDTALLEERTQMMGTLQTLLDAVNHASTEQRTAIDALVATSADLLERVGTRFTDHVQAETGKLEHVAAQVAAGATEVAGLGDALGSVVERFGQTNDALLERLQAIEGALERSLVRSDEQLAYYVAQAREVVDLSLCAQRQITVDLQRLAGADAA
ncbi:DUF802 domain-containing protein [Pseudoxanthomonas mexicana]|uniref:DUF802 domain-containing protein n=1 Tax=Pseudoxanthomonas mexicana TaxID=128785 RepID=A0ABX6RCG1_PSEMX|nr:DUF802 domain-containing protein [Pseudoxanthomonas mexicana]QND80867.1 DUF802 domain-containing protein [Pseudoxanthomonas mexicana]